MSFSGFIERHLIIFVYDALSEWFVVFAILWKRSLDKNDCEIQMSVQNLLLLTTVSLKFTDKKLSKMCAAPSFHTLVCRVQFSCGIGLRLYVYSGGYYSGKLLPLVLY